MNCKNCGNLLSAEDKFCKKCGQPVEQPAVQNLGVNNQAQTTNNVQGVQPNVIPVQSSINVQSVQTNTTPLTNSPVQTYTGPKKHTNPVLFVIIGLLFVGVIAFGILYFTQKNNAKDLSNPTEEQVVTQNFSKMNYKGYTFSVPVDYITKENGSLFVYDDTEEWVVKIGIYPELTYEVVKSGVEKIKSALEAGGTTVNSIEEKSINGNKWIMVEYTNNGNKYLGGYGKTTSNHVVSLEISNYNNINDVNKFNEFEKICSEARVFVEKGIISTDTINSELIDLSEVFK